MNIWITGRAGFNIAYMADVMDQKSVNWEHHQPCVRGEAWQWQGLRSARTGLYKVATIKEITIPVC